MAFSREARAGDRLTGGDTCGSTPVSVGVCRVAQWSRLEVSTEPIVIGSPSKMWETLAANSGVTDPPDLRRQFVL